MGKRIRPLLRVRVGTCLRARLTCLSPGRSAPLGIKTILPLGVAMAGLLAGVFWSAVIFLLVHVAVDIVYALLAHADGRIIKRILRHGTKPALHQHGVDPVVHGLLHAMFIV